MEYENSYTKKDKKMDEKIEVSLNRIKLIIGKLKDKNKSFTTADVIREYSGGFYSNINTPPAYSFNAQFGKILKRNEDELEISEIKSKVQIEDDCKPPHLTTASEWKSKIL